MISRIVTGKIIKHYKLQKKNTDLIWFFKKAMWSDKPKWTVFSKKNYQSTKSKLQKMIEDFFSRDDVSRLSAGKKTNHN